MIPIENSATPHYLERDMARPKISVLMSVYKEPLEWLHQSIDSILQQTFQEFEFIIVNDNPDRGDAISLLTDYAEKDARIKLLFNEVNIGLTKSLNKGLVVAKGKYIARMDADDISLPERFEKQIAYMDEHLDVVVLGTMVKHFGKKSWWKPNEAKSFTDEDLKAQMLFGNCIAHPTAMIRKKILDENNIRYDEQYRHSQDYRLWEQLVPYGHFAKLKQALLLYRVSDQQITKKSSSSQSKLSQDISYRCQNRWLDGEGMCYSIDDIKANPFRIINEIKQGNKFVKSKCFSALVQFSYLNHPDAKSHITSFLKGDFRYMTFWNIIRYLLKL